MDRLIINSRRGFFFPVMFMFLASEKKDEPQIYIPLIILVIYILVLEIFQYKSEIRDKVNLIFESIDILFITWAFFYFGNEIFLVFYFILIFASKYKYESKKALIIALTILFLFYLVSFFQIDWTEEIWKPIIYIFLIRPVVFYLALCAAKNILLNEKDTKEELGELKKQVKRKNNILSTLSHELRTPLTMIKTSSEIVLEGRPGEINEIQRNFLNTILSNAVRIIKLVEDILARIKIESTWLKLDLKEIDIRPLVKKVVNNIMPIINQKNQIIRYFYPKLMSKTLADGNWLQQVIINLIHNASKNVGENGNIIIAVKENEQCIIVSVSDDGCGIENLRKIRIFSEYYQSDDIFEDYSEGIGLGLAIVKHVVEKHDGKVYVSSVPGMGTTFSFTLQKESRGSI